MNLRGLLHVSEKCHLDGRGPNGDAGWLRNVPVGNACDLVVPNDDQNIPRTQQDGAGGGIANE